MLHLHSYISRLVIFLLDEELSHAPVLHLRSLAVHSLPIFFPKRSAIRPRPHYLVLAQTIGDVLVRVHTYRLD